MPAVARQIMSRLQFPLAAFISLRISADYRESAAAQSRRSRATKRIINEVTAIGMPKWPILDDSRRP